MLSPLFIYLAYKVSRDGGSAFFGHERVGQDGRNFKCYKFRSMVVNAQEVLKDLLERDPVARAEWDKDIASRTQQALVLEQAARAKERSLLAAKHEVEAKYVDLKTQQARSAAGAKRELARLRDQLATANSNPAGDTASQPGVHGASIPGEFLGSCAEALAGMAEEADEVRARLIGLQGYVRGVCERSGFEQGINR